MTPRRITILVLIIVLAALLPVIWLTVGPRAWPAMAFIGAGIVIGAWYLWRGGLPDWLHSPHKYLPGGETLRQFGIVKGINREDDPDNLPFRTWGPILLAFILLAAGAIVAFVVFF